MALATKFWLLDVLHCDPAFSEMLHLLLTSHSDSIEMLFVLWHCVEYFWVPGHSRVWVEYNT